MSTIQSSESCQSVLTGCLHHCGPEEGERVAARLLEQWRGGVAADVLGLRCKCCAAALAAGVEPTFEVAQVGREGTGKRRGDLRGAISLFSSSLTPLPPPPTHTHTPLLSYLSFSLAPRPCSDPTAAPLILFPNRPATLSLHAFVQLHVTTACRVIVDCSHKEFTQGWVFYMAASAVQLP